MATTKNDLLPILSEATAKLEEALQALGQPNLLRQWRFWHGPAGTVDPQRAISGDVSDWEEVTTPRGWSTASGETWLRGIVRYPEAVEGIPTAGSPLEMGINLPVHCRVYVNGELAAGHDWWLDARIAPIPLAEALHPGQSFEVACVIPQGDGLGGFGGARLRCQRVQETVNALELLRAQLAFSRFLAAQKGARAQSAWRKAVEGLPWAALAARDWGKWQTGAAEGIAKLAALVPEAKDYVVHAAGHAHIDMNWLWPWEDTVDVIRRDFRTMDQLMDRYPELHFTQSQASTYWAMEVYEPEILERVKARVAEGRWEVAANTWVENDMNMSSSEAIAHHFLYTRRYMEQLFGAKPRLLWEPDTFGHPATLPQITRKGGAEYHYFCRGGKGDPLFWWESEDGSRVLSVHEPHWYLGEINPWQTVEKSILLAERCGLQHSLMVYGVGDHGGGATIRDLEMARAIDAAPCLPTLRLDTVTAFFDAVKAANPELPVRRGELNPVFAGCYTSHADVKRLNRAGERTLTDAEAVATAAALLTGHPYPHAALEDSWRAVLFQQFHDILCGCGIGITSRTAHAWAEPAIARGKALADAALAALAKQLDTGDGPAACVFNSLPWSRTDPVALPVDWECAWVTDDRGQRLPAQRSAEGLLIVAEEVPALGFRVYRPGDATPLPGAGDVALAAPLTLENAHLRVQVDARSGAITHLWDKEAKRDLAANAHNERNAGLDTTGPLNRLEVWWEQPHGMSAWQLGNISRIDRLVSGAEARLVESGPVRGTIEVRRSLLHSTLVQRLHLYRGSRAVVFDTEIDWHERGSDQTDAPMLRARFDATLGPTAATFQVPFGTIQRPADGQESAAQMWGDLTETTGEYGVALLNDCKYGYQAHGNTLGLTLVRASYEPDRNPDEGLHRFRYAYYPHLGTWQAAGVEEQAQGFNRPLLARAMQSAGAGTLQPGAPAISIAGEGVVATTVKLAEAGGGDVIVRLLELRGEAAVAELRLARPILSAGEVSLDEEPLVGAAPCAVADGAARVTLGPHEFKTIRLRIS